MNREETDDGAEAVLLDNTETKTTESPGKEKPKKEKPIDQLLKHLDISENLVAYLKSEMNLPGKEPMFSEAAEQAFIKHEIDGHAFQSLATKHLTEMGLELTLGERLHLLSKAQIIRRAIRMEQRNNIILKVQCNIMAGTDDSEGKDGTLILSNSSVKFKYMRERSKEIPAVPKNCCCLLFFKKAKTIETGLVRILDHIDLSLIEDVDYREIETTKTIRVQNAWFGDKFYSIEKTKINKFYMYINLTIPDQIRSTSMGTKVSTIRLEIKDRGQAEKLKNELLDAVEEVQFEEGTRYNC